MAVLRCAAVTPRRRATIMWRESLRSANPEAMAYPISIDTAIQPSIDHYDDIQTHKR